MSLSGAGGRSPDPLNFDRQIKLPDDVLLNILERVDTLDAVKTCLTSNSKQMLNLLTMLPHIGIVLSARELVRKNGVVADVTEKILSCRSPQIPIRNLKLKFIMRGDDHTKIGRSVTRALATHSVEAAEFEILTSKCTYDCSRADILSFAKQFNTFIGDCPDAFAGLTRLHLQNMRFGDSDIPNILSTCKRLESLHLILCDSGVKSVLQVEHARLVELDITYGYFSTVELKYLPKLQRMSYTNWRYNKNPLVLSFVPQLSKLSLTSTYVDLDNTIKISQLLVNVPSIRDLHLNFQSEKVWLHQESVKLLAPVLHKLRFANLDNISKKCGIAWTLSFLEVAPSLEELCVTVSDHKCQIDSRLRHLKKTEVKWEPSVADFEHKNLVKLAIHGFESDDNFTRYVRCVMKVAVNIQEVSLHDRKVCEPCGNISDKLLKYPQTSQEKDLISKKIREALVKASPVVIRFEPSSYYPPQVVEYM